MKHDFKFTGLQHAYLAAHYDDIKHSPAWRNLCEAERGRICSYRAMRNNPEKYPQYKMFRYTENEFSRLLDTAALLKYFETANDNRYIYILEHNGSKVRSEPVSWNTLKTMVDNSIYLGVSVCKIEIVDVQGAHT